MKLIKSIFLAGVVTFLLNATIVAQQTGSLGGQVVDALGSVVVGATVTAVSSDGKEKTTATNQRGEYTISGLAPGTYIVRVIADKFAFFENPQVEVKAGPKTQFSPTLTVAAVEQKVEVSADSGVSTDPQNNGDATVLKEKDLEALPDDPDELEAALQALAGPSAGPNGGQIYIDGFTGGRLPPKDAIREIRINQNPFSAEYDRLGFGRIEILTKPGSDKWRGSAFGNFNDESLNSRNPFAANRAPSQTRFFGGNISGPVKKKKSSFFLDISNRDQDTNAVVNATILDPNLSPVLFNQEVLVPTRRFTVSPRFDYQINDKNTLVARYSFTRSTFKNQGINETSLPSRAFSTASTNHEFRLTETMIINPKTVNETRFQYEYNNRDQVGDNSIPTISVSSAFTGGGAQIGHSFNKSKDIEISNFTTTTLGKKSQHGIKFGGRFHTVNVDDRSESNYGGTFSFPGAPEVRTPLGCIPTGPTDPNCTVLLPAISPLDQYRGKLLGNTDTRYIPTQFSITTGNPLQSVSRTDVGLFAMDDWRFRPGLTLSFGLRYENQTNIKDPFNFAPRFSFAWSPGAGGAKAPKTVIRGGFGLFYDRFSENYTLAAERFNGINQLSLVVSANETDPVRQAAAIALLSQPVFTLNGVTNVPTAVQIIATLPQSNVIRTIDPNLQVPYTFQAAVGVDRQLPWKTTLSAYYIGSRTQHILRTRNINAPICPEQIDCNSAPVPDPSQGPLYEYESSGISNQNQMIVSLRANPSTKYSINASYRLGFAKSDTDGGFPAYTYDLAGEYGRSSGDIRHVFNLFANFNLPWGISASPNITAQTGRPFNIIKGIDLNGDLLFTERPTFAELGARCTQLGITTSYCDVSGQDPNAIIPRNFGQAPGFFAVNLRLGKNFGFGGEKAATASGDSGGGRGGRGGGRGGAVMVGGGGGDRGGFGGGGFGGGSGKPYNLNVGINFSNIFNNVNFGVPIGNLASSRFGQSTSTYAGFGGFGAFGGGGGTANRRIDLSLRFSW
jgi:hypothetical protein